MTFKTAKRKGLKMYGYDDFYNEPNEFEQQIEEFKKGLIKAIKTEYTEEMEHLRKENAELQAVKARMKEIETEHKNAVYQLKRKEEEAERKALNKLLENARLMMFAADTTYEEKPKCDKCNEKRQIEYKTPLGKTSYENCTCSNKTAVYVPKEIMRYEFCQRCGNGELTAWYKFIEKADDHVCVSEYSYGDVRKIYDGSTPYEELKSRDVMFKTVEDCQKYCDWLNATTTTAEKWGR